MAFNFGTPLGNWGTTTATIAPAGGFGGFGTTSTTAGSAFSFSAPANTGTIGLFGGIQNKGFGFGISFGRTMGTSTGLGTGLGFGGQQQQQQSTLGGLSSQPTPAPTQCHQLINTASALSAPTLLGDDRDAILAFWVTGKGYFNNNIPPVEFIQENPFCWFKAFGYSCMPNYKDEDGLVVLVVYKKETDIRSQQQQLVGSLHKVLGGNQTLAVNVEGIKTLPDDRTDFAIYVVEHSPNGTSRRVPATTLYSHFGQANIKTQLQQIGITLSMTRTELFPNPPGVDPVVWEQAKVDNPDSEKVIPVPMVQDQMAKQHQTRISIITEDISEQHKNQTTSMAKIAQYKRTLMDFSHRIFFFFFFFWKSGYAMHAEEEQLRVWLHILQSELNAPTQFKSQLNEMMSQIRMQNHFGAVIAEERYYIDQHSKQQESLSHLISIIKDDLEDIKFIEHGLNETIHIRGGGFS
uniref:Nucleoporin Nup54 alpha-helical domain-containing protein n=1 Tax=Chinchilla lanigera TaxID=34839 RepID=A0A8C2VDT0_CHILA